MKMKQQLLTEKAEKAQRYSDDFDSGKQKQCICDTMQS